MKNLLVGRSVLVVEDEYLILIMIEDMLADFGCNSIATASTIATATPLINTRTFDFVLLDMNLNGTDSHPLAEMLFDRHIPFIYSTGNTRVGFANIPVLGKPYSSLELALAIGSIKLARAFLG